MKRINAISIISFLAGVCFIAAFILHGGTTYLILGCFWIIIGIGRIFKPPVRK